MSRKTHTKHKKKIKRKNLQTLRVDSDAPRHKLRLNRYVLRGGAAWDGSIIPRERIRFLYEDVPRREIPNGELPEILKTVTSFANTTDICPIDLKNQPEYVLKACKHAISSHGYGELARSQVPPPLQFNANLMFNCPMCRAPQIPGGPLGGVFCPAVEINPGLPTLHRQPDSTSPGCEKLKLSEKGNTKSKYVGTLPDSNLTFTLEIHQGLNGFEAHIILPKPRPKRGGKTRKRRRRRKRK